MTTATAPHLTLNNAIQIPAIGLGVFQTPPEETPKQWSQPLLRDTGISTRQPPMRTSAR